MGLHAECGDGRDKAPARRGVACLSNEFGDRNQGVEHDQSRECGDEPGQQRWALAFAMVTMRSRPNADAEDDGQKHRNTHQLDHRGRIAGFRRDCVTRADDLGHVMDCRADEDASMVIVETE